MKPELEKKLVEKYPKIFRDYNNPDPKATLMCFGFECDDGWYDIIDSLCSVISQVAEQDKIDIYAVQVKEKYGGLRFYTNHTCDTIFGAIWMAENMSHRICEICGAPGKTNSKGWLKTTCEKHR